MKNFDLSSCRLQIYLHIKIKARIAVTNKKQTFFLREQHLSHFRVFWGTHPFLYFFFPLLFKDTRRLQMKEAPPSLYLKMITQHWQERIRSFLTRTHAHSFTRAFVWGRQPLLCISLSLSHSLSGYTKEDRGTGAITQPADKWTRTHYRRKDEEFAASVKEPETKHSTCQYWQGREKYTDAQGNDGGGKGL